MTVKRVFLIGFGASLALLAISSSYAFSPVWKGTVLLQFDQSVGHVSLPPAYRYAVLGFVLLNIPPVLLTTLVVAALNRVVSLTPAQIGVMGLVLSITGSAVWWWLIGRISEKLRRQRAVSLSRAESSALQRPG